MTMIKKLNKKGRFAMLVNIIAAVITSLAVFSGCTLPSVTQNTEISSDSYTGEALTVSYINVGQADSILIQSPDGKNMLIDAGETTDGSVLGYLNSKGITRLDAVIATHPHTDHISEMADVIKNYEIGDFYMPKASTTTKSFENMIDALSDKGIAPVQAKAGISFYLGNSVECKMLAPCSDSYDNLNNYSAVIKLTYGETSFLFTGDAEELSEKEILAENADLKADVLKVGHHGSSSSTSQAFLSAVNPKYAVISCGKDNSYGHPNQETIQKLSGIAVYVTKDDGTIVIKSDSKNIYVDTDNETDLTQQSDIGNAASDTSAEAAKESSDKNTDEANTQAQSITYIGNINSKKYHSSSCNSLPNTENRIYFSSKEEAENSGYTPHKTCVKD